MFDRKVKTAIANYVLVRSTMGTTFIMQSPDETELQGSLTIHQPTHTPLTRPLLPMQLHRGIGCITMRVDAQKQGMQG